MPNKLDPQVFKVPTGKYLLLDFGIPLHYASLVAYGLSLDAADAVAGTLDIEASNDLSSWTSTANVAVRKNTRTAAGVPAGTPGDVPRRYLRVQRGTLRGPFQFEVVVSGLPVISSLEDE